jgi:phosphatidylinositol-4,5-bisphosphate 3-kinase
LQEEILDESQNLNDVRPFWPVLKLIEKRGDKMSKTMDRRINNLIGKGTKQNYYEFCEKERM